MRHGNKFSTQDLGFRCWSPPDDGAAGSSGAQGAGGASGAQGNQGQGEGASGSGQGAGQGSGASGSRPVAEAAGAVAGATGGAAATGTAAGAGGASGAAGGAGARTDQGTGAASGASGASGKTPREIELEQQLDAERARANNAESAALEREAAELERQGKWKELADLRKKQVAQQDVVIQQIGYRNALQTHLVETGVELGVAAELAKLIPIDTMKASAGGTVEGAAAAVAAYKAANPKTYERLAGQVAAAGASGAAGAAGATSEGSGAGAGTNNNNNNNSNNAEGDGRRSHRSRRAGALARVAGVAPSGSPSTGTGAGDPARGGSAPVSVKDMDPAAYKNYLAGFTGNTSVADRRARRLRGGATQNS